MIVRYCDCCGERIWRNYVAQRLKGDAVVEDVRVGVEVIAGTGDTPAVDAQDGDEHAADDKTGPVVWNRGELCLVCLLRAIIRIVNDG